MPAQVRVLSVTNKYTVTVPERFKGVDLKLVFCFLSTPSDSYDLCEHARQFSDHSMKFQGARGRHRVHPRRSPKKSYG
ncbi:predicted protein [Micromonas commoda]|uniref:Uncharacterized protein n=1 Tax=Micromonas commoda (strain RCC299 / NOUM17 / CCMP2709) TaxID=296587 RepID=C1E954_MICCC|nr:predicted protein [Micromonas commoda]ACO64624.1 predicted protein [Micromonas commoda]|eukprot:XP_002503366.1 predicted protein [Micromonas commoda]